MFVSYVCNTCGSNSVSRDAWAKWDVKSQDWVLRDPFDYAYCHRCDEETSLQEVELSPPEKFILPA